MVRRLAAIATMIAILAGLTSVALAVTVGPGSDLGFEIDGDFTDNPSGPPDDWNVTTPIMSIDDTFDSGFTQGSKELAPSAWDCNTGGANPNKGDILRAYVNTRVGASGAFVDLGWVAQNISGEGDVHLNFEFNQNGAAEDPEDFVAGPCDIPRVEDDILVTYDFPGGTASPNIQVFRWDATPASGDDGAWINQNIPASAARAAVNATTMQDPFDGTINPQRFGEATIDLLAALPPGAISGCADYGFLNVRSRSSGESVTSAIQDKLPTTAIDLNTCGKIILHKVDDHVPPQALMGASFGLWGTSDTSVAPLQTSSSAADGKVTFENVEPGDYWVKEISAPSGYDADPDAVGPIVVGFRETVDVSQAFVDPRHTGTIRIVKTLADEHGDPVVPDDASDLDGAAFLVFKDGNGNGTYEAGEEAKLWPNQTTNAACTITGGAGSCDVGPLPTGTYGVHETAAPAGTNLGDDIYPVVVVKNTTVEVEYENSLSPLNITIDKSGPERVHRGDTIHYTFAVTTSGPKLHDVTVEEVTADRCDGAIAGPDKTGDQDSFLEPGETWTFSCDHVVTVNDPDPLPNEAMVTGTDDFGRDVSDSDTHSVDILDPAITLDKKVNGGDHKPVGNALVKHVGDALTYTVTVTNTGDTALNITALADSLKAGLPTFCTAGIGSNLLAGASFSCTYPDAATADKHNVASVTGVDVLGGAKGTVSATDETFVDVIHPEIEIVKTGTTEAHEGDPVSYDFEVTNTGDVPLTDVSVDDDKLGHIGDIASLAVGASATLHKNVTAGADDVTNVATACGSDPLDANVCDDDDHTLNIINPSILIVKSGTEMAHEGDAVSYTFDVTNNGDVDLADVSVDDDKLGHIGDIALLEVGETEQLTKNVTAGSVDVTNVAEACGTDPLDDEVCDDDDHTLDIIHPDIEIVKTGTAMAHEGDATSYSFKVTNTGDVDLTNVSVDDDKLGHIGDIASLPAGEDETLTINSTAPADDMTNVAEACGDDPLDEAVCDDDDHTIDVIHPDIIVVKDGDATAHEGDSVTYTFDVTNTGDVDLTDVSVDDDKLGHIGDIALLEVGETEQLSKTVTAGNADVTNVADACGDDPLDAEICDDDDHELDIIHPGIDVEKSGDAKAHEGDNVTYTFDVTNTGDVPLTGVVVTDDILGAVGTLATLNVGQTVQMTKDFEVPASTDAVDNIVEACGVGPLGSREFCDTDEHHLVVIHPAITLDKKLAGADHKPVGDALIAHEGDELGYTVEVTNTGDTPLEITALEDSLHADLGADCSGDVGDSLDPNEKITCTYTDTAGADDVHNVASVEGVDELGGTKGTVSASDETFADVIHPAIEIDKTGAEVAHEGDTVTYTFEVTNTGDVDLSDVAVTDDVLGDIGTIDALAVGASATLTKDFEVPADVDGVDNVGTACGTDVGSVEVCDDDPHSLLVIHPSVEIVKTANPTSAEPGQTVTYSFEVTNAGDTTLNDILVTDDILGDIGTIDSLEPGETVTLTREMVVEADSPRTNIGTACGTDALDKEVCDDDDATISIVLPAPPEPRLPATGFRALLWTAFGMALIAAGLAMLEHKRVWLANRI
jgi:uncharacterized repeat protein (TIGR01451 family)